jgi:hypothetical protein
VNERVHQRAGPPKGCEINYRDDVELGGADLAGYKVETTDRSMTAEMAGAASAAPVI